MTDEVQVAEPLPEIPAPEQAVTATPEPEDQSPDTPQVTKTFTQEEVDAFVAKRAAQIERRLKRELLQNRPAASTPPQDVPPPEQFNSTEEYAQALAEKRAHELLAEREQQKQRAEILETYHEREEEARGKYDDFEQVAYNPRLPVTDVMAETIQASEVGPDIAYYLGSNPKEAERIARLSPLLQAKEIGKIELKISNDPPVKKTSSAPPPITPVTARSTGAPAYDTTDPRSVKTMSTSEWIEAERQRQIKKWEAQRRH